MFFHLCERLACRGVFHHYVVKCCLLGTSSYSWQEVGSHVFLSSGGFSNGVNDVMVVMVGFFSLVNIDLFCA